MHPGGGGAGNTSPPQPLNAVERPGRTLRAGDRCACGEERGRDAVADGLLGADVGDLYKLLIVAGSLYI